MTRPVTVADMLAARDARVVHQNHFLRRHAAPLISFTMNIAGEIKADAAICRAFEEGVKRIRRELERLNAPVLEYAQSTTFTGCEALWAVDADAALLKARMCCIEEADELGRLFDIDVIDGNGQHLSRKNERSCLICGGPVRAYARSRTHSAQELFRRAHEIIEGHFREHFVRRIGECAQQALLFEALTTPKPGLVDCRNTGAHRDMDLFSFAASACTLRPFFDECVRLGMDGASPEQLQYAGMLAEDAMLHAAGANTHKGAIFSLGILCCALGQCGEDAELADVLHKASEIGQHFLQQMKDAGHTSTGGEQQFAAYGLTGARGEAASGFRTVTEIALPALEEALHAGKPLPEAGLHALIALLAHVQDSNVIRRAGMEGQQWLTMQAQHLLDEGFYADDLYMLDDACIARNISPGGSADLLAATYFLHFIKTSLPSGKGADEP